MANLILPYCLLAMRYLLALLCVLFILYIIKIFKMGKPVPLYRLYSLNNRNKYDVCNYECSIGRSKICDVCLNLGSVSRRHAILTYNDRYGLRIDTVNGSSVNVNGIEVDGYAYVENGDTINIGGAELSLSEFSSDNDISSRSKKKKQKSVGFFGGVMLLSAIQFIMCFELMLHYRNDFVLAVPACFIILIASEWGYFIFRRMRNIGIELMGVFLTSFGFCVAASATPTELYKITLTAIAGFAAFIALTYILRNIELVMKLRYVFGAMAIILFAYNIFFGVTRFGAKNWIDIGGIFTLQPSELIKFAFIFAGSATLARLFTRRNLLLFILYTGFCLGALAVMRDFGTALIYFCTALIIMYMRSGDVKIITIITAAVGVLGVVAIKVFPYITRRFEAYLHAWEYAADKGYQQTRTMIAVASGGLFGVGGGEGNLDRVAASDTDLVFGILSEEWGMIAAFCAVACFIIFAIYSLRCTARTNSAYYAISACAASGLFIVQISLNIFGSLDLLPLTGVTMPFISNGGSSMLASWALLALIHAVGANTARRDTE